MRQRVACGTCALVEWIDNCFPCYLFAECPEEVKPKQGKSNDDCDSDDDDTSEERDPEAEEVAANQRRGILLRDSHGYYILDAGSINSLLDVRKYIESWPLIPAEELHASSVQHPSYPHFGGCFTHAECAHTLQSKHRLQTHVSRHALGSESRISPSGCARAALRLSADLSLSCRSLHSRTGTGAVDSIHFIRT